MSEIVIVDDVANICGVTLEVCTNEKGCENCELNQENREVRNE